MKILGACSIQMHATTPSPGIYASETVKACVTWSRKLKTEWLGTPRHVREQTGTIHLINIVS